MCDLIQGAAEEEGSCIASLTKNIRLQLNQLFIPEVHRGLHPRELITLGSQIITFVFGLTNTRNKIPEAHLVGRLPLPCSRSSRPWWTGFKIKFIAKSPRKYLMKRPSWNTIKPQYAILWLLHSSINMQTHTTQQLHPEFSHNTSGVSLVGGLHGTTGLICSFKTVGS